MNINTVHRIDCVEGLNSLEAGCAKLIIVDPPYFEVKGEFDFIWPDFEAYLADVEKWALACKRVLAPNGTLFWWGHALKIAYSQIILDKFFNLENNLVWEKKDCQTRKNRPSDMRTFATVTERLLMYSNFNQFENYWKNNNATVFFEGFEQIRQYLRSEISKVGVKKVADFLGVTDRSIGHYITRSQWYAPNQTTYEKIRSLGIFPMPWAEFSQWVEAAKQEWKRDEDGRRTFQFEGKLLTDVLLYAQESNISQQFNHPTQKPEKLTSMLINTTTKAGDLVVVPFAGSGTECAMAAANNRKFIGFDIDPSHVETANKRCEAHLKQTKLF